MAKNLTKAEKRKMRENTNEFVDIAHISNHYFKELKNWTKVILLCIIMVTEFIKNDILR